MPWFAASHQDPGWHFRWANGPIRSLGTAECGFRVRFFQDLLRLGNVSFRFRAAADPLTEGGCWHRRIAFPQLRQNCYDGGLVPFATLSPSGLVIKMSQPPIQVKVHQSLGTISIHRDEKRNALTRAMVFDLIQAFRDLHGERKVRAIVLTGGGSAFCSGLCLEEMHEIVKEDDNFDRWHQDTSSLAELLQLMLQFPKPIIAAVNGPAMGFGAGLVLASDIAIAGPDASLGFPEPKRGIVSGLCTPLLHFRTGGRHAARPLLTGETISAERAVQIGAYDEIVPAKNLWAYAAELTQQISQAAPQAVQLTKKHLNETVGEQLEMLISLGAAASATSRTTDAAKEGLTAYLEKREPEWP